VANFSANLTTINAGSSVNFTDLSTNNPTSWSWTFEGAQTATSALQNPSNIVYPTAGVYDVALTVSNAFGSDTESKTNYITVNVVNPLIADFTADKIVIERGEVVHFTDISSGNPVFWSWEIEGGDPTLVHLQNPAVVFDFAGSYDVKLTVYRAGGYDVEIKYDYIQVNEIESDLPPGWDFVATSRSHIIAVPLEANPRIHLTPLQPGDFIGVFYNGPGGVPICGGNTMWDGVSNLPVIAFGDESSTIFKDGFSVNEAFQWKIYSVSMQREFDATVAYDPTMAKTGNFYPYGLSALTDIYSGDVFNVSIPAGWSGISSPVDPWEKNLEALFSPLDGNLAMFYNFNGMYLPGLNINTLVNWNNHTAYNIKLEYPAELEFLGYPEKNRTVAIPQGWSYLPVPVACDVDVLPLFLSNLSKLVIVREVSGFNMYWPQYNIQTLTTLQPGKAYMINASAAFNLQFPVCTSTFKNSGNIQANSIHLNPSWNPLPAGASVHTFAVTGQALDQLKTGDVLGAFTSEGFCAGMARFEGKEFAVSVFGDDITTPEKDGFEESEPAIFKIFRPSDGTEIMLDASFDPSLPQDGNFAGNGLSAISAFKVSTEAGGIYKTINPAIHPNPSQGKFVISGILEVSKITVMNIELQKILEINVDGVNTKSIDLSQQPKGVYLISFETPNGPLLRKIVID
jgi:PKD repeat protein